MHCLRSLWGVSKSFVGENVATASIRFTEMTQTFRYIFADWMAYGGYWALAQDLGEHREQERGGVYALQVSGMLLLLVVAQHHWQSAFCRSAVPACSTQYILGLTGETLFEWHLEKHHHQC